VENVLLQNLAAILWVLQKWPFIAPSFNFLKFRPFEVCVIPKH